MRASKKSVLKPCPFCGGEAVKWRDEDPYGPGGPILTDWVIDCTSCGISVRSKDSKAVTRKWNRRVE